MKVIFKRNQIHQQVEFIFEFIFEFEIVGGIEIVIVINIKQFKF